MHEAEAPAREPLPLVLVYITALTCGLLLALAVHIALAAHGGGLTSVMRGLFPSAADQLRSALAWWAIGLSGCAGSWGAILLLRKTSRVQPAHRLLRVGLALAFVSLLAAAGHAASSVTSDSGLISAAANVAAMALGSFMAFFVAHFAARH
jgi:hypothetical protein